MNVALDNTIKIWLVCHVTPIVLLAIRLSFVYLVLLKKFKSVQCRVFFVLAKMDFIYLQKKLYAKLARIHVRRVRLLTQTVLLV